MTIWKRILYLDLSLIEKKSSFPMIKRNHVFFQPSLQWWDSQCRFGLKKIHVYDDVLRSEKHVKIRVFQIVLYSYHTHTHAYTHIYIYILKHFDVYTFFIYLRTYTFHWMSQRKEHFFLMFLRFFFVDRRRECGNCP